MYAFVIFYHATFFKYFGEGPMWKPIVEPEVQDCRDNWWTNILYINNYVNVDHMVSVLIFINSISDVMPSSDRLLGDIRILSHKQVATVSPKFGKVFTSSTY